jgi:glycosyltransferase involved in cell wall biosynthesis
MTRSVLFALRKLTIGGAERVAADLAEALVTQGYRVSVLHEAPLPQQARTKSAAGWFGRARLLAADDLDRQRPLVDALAAVAADTLVLCGPSLAYRQLAAARSLNPALRVVGFMFNARQLVEEHRGNAAHMDRVICESEGAARALLGGSDAALQVSVVSSGVDLDAIMSRPLKTRNGPLTIGYVGRFDRSKNARGFLKIVEGLRDKGPRFIMAGPAPRFFWPPGRVSYAGALLGEEKEALLDQIDVLIVPSLNDGRPLIIHEMQARGRVVIASAVGAIPELIEDGVNGLLCPPGDVAAFRAAILRVTQDPFLRVRLGDEARRRVRHQGDWTASLPRYLDAILGDASV